MTVVTDDDGGGTRGGGLAGGGVHALVPLMSVISLSGNTFRLVSGDTGVEWDFCLKSWC